MRLILIAAFVSLSSVVWQHSHSQMRCLSERLALIVPHTWQTLLEGAHLSIFTTVVSVLLATHSRIDTNSAKARSEIFRPHKRFIPSILRSSIQMMAYSPTSWFANLKNQSRLRMFILFALIELESVCLYNSAHVTASFRENIPIILQHLVVL